MKILICSRFDEINLFLFFLCLSANKLLRQMLEHEITCCTVHLLLHPIDLRSLDSFFIDSKSWSLNTLDVLPEILAKTVKSIFLPTAIVYNAIFCLRQSAAAWQNETKRHTQNWWTMQFLVKQLKSMSRNANDIKYEVKS